MQRIVEKRTLGPDGRRLRLKILGLALAGFWVVAPCSTAGDCPPIDGDDQDNVLNGTSCGEVIRGHDGDDTIHAAAGDDNVNGGKGDDQIFGEEGSDLIDGWSGDDRVEGGPGDDKLVGFGGADRLYGQDGNDELKGGSDDDHLDGGPGNDTLLGGGGNDYLDDTEGLNLLDGMSFHDTVVGRTNSGTLRGGTEDDFLVIVGNSIEGYDLVDGDRNLQGRGSDLLFFARDANPEMVTVENGQRFLKFDLRTQAAVDIDLNQVFKIEAVATGDGNDRLTGTDTTALFAYRNRLGGLMVHELFFSGAGNDIIITGLGDDFVDAGEGDDTVHLGNGAHYLIGGPGKDTFVWAAEALAGKKVSRITDLESGDVVQWKGDWSTEDVSLETTEVDDQAATAVRLNGRVKLNLLGVESEGVRLRQARDGVWIDVLHHLSSRGKVEANRRLPLRPRGR